MGQMKCSHFFLVDAASLEKKNTGQTVFKLEGKGFFFFKHVFQSKINKKKRTGSTTHKKIYRNTLVWKIGEKRKTSVKFLKLLSSVILGLHTSESPIETNFTLTFDYAN